MLHVKCPAQMINVKCSMFPHARRQEGLQIQRIPKISKEPKGFQRILTGFSQFQKVCQQTKGFKEVQRMLKYFDLKHFKNYPRTEQDVTGFHNTPNNFILLIVAGRLESNFPDRPIRPHPKPPYHTHGGIIRLSLLHPLPSSFSSSTSTPAFPLPTTSSLHH